MTLGRIAAKAGKRELHVEAPAQLGQTESRQACRCELDRERQPIELATDLFGLSQQRIADNEVRIGGATPLNEELQRSGCIHRTCTKDLFATNCEAFARSCKDAHDQ